MASNWVAEDNFVEVVQENYSESLRRQNLLRLLEVMELKLYPIPAITRFQPPRASDTPRMLFFGAHRFFRCTDPREILIYTDGACLGNGLANPAAGCGFIINPQHKVHFRLENRGPTGEFHTQTSNRAELRAVIAALEYRHWQGDNMGSCSRIVIATDSEYVVLGITEWIHKWNQQNWKTASGQPVKNQDLWMRLISQIKRLDRPESCTQPPHGTAVAFWRIPREWNAEADWEAKRGAECPEMQKYAKLNGVLI